MSSTERCLVGQKSTPKRPDAARERDAGTCHNAPGKGASWPDPSPSKKLSGLPASAHIPGAGRMLLEDRPEAKELSFTRDGLAIDDAGPWAEAQPRSPVCRGFVRFATRSGVSPRLKQFQTLLLLIVVLIRQKKAPTACAGASKEVSRAPRDQGALDAPIVSQGTNHARRGLAMRIDGSTESAHRTFPTLRQRGRVFSLRCLYLSPGRPVGASCSRRRPPRRLQVFGPVRERRRAARSQSFLRRPIASLPMPMSDSKNFKSCLNKITNGFSLRR
jgi:hypothetical protein